MGTNRYIVGGYSPTIFSLPDEILKTGPVIGINLWGRDFPCDYWIALDTFRYPEWKAWMEKMNTIKYMRAPKSDKELSMGIPGDAVDHWFKKAPEKIIPISWDGSLQWISSTAMAAINLAIILGAEEVVLYGVDFIGQARADGSQYSRSNFWDNHREGINNLLRKFQRYVTIYKMNPASWLDCPLLED